MCSNDNSDESTEPISTYQRGGRAADYKLRLPQKPTLWTQQSILAVSSALSNRGKAY